MRNLPNKIIVFLKAGITIALCVLVVFSVLSALSDSESAKAKALNNLRPISFESLYVFIERQDDIDEKKLKEYAHYYEKVSEFIPKAYSAHAMAGLCYWHLKNIRRSTFHYMKAAELAPKFFWNHYNLGVIYFREKQYRQASSYLKDALAADPKLTIKSLYTSKIYRVMLRYFQPNYAPDISIQEAYKKIKIMLTLCLAYIKAPQVNFDIPKEISAIEPQIF